MVKDVIATDDMFDVKVRVMLDWNEHCAAETHYAVALSCLQDAELIATERDYHSLSVLIREALGDLKMIGRIFDINGQKRLEASHAQTQA